MENGPNTLGPIHTHAEKRTKEKEIARKRKKRGTLGIEPRSPPSHAHLPNHQATLTHLLTKYNNENINQIS